MKFILYALGVAVTANSVFAWFTSNFNLGNVMTLLFGLALLAFAMFYCALTHAIRAVAYAVFAAAILCISLLLGCGFRDTATYEEDAIIVLGAAVRGEIPSGALRDRLDVAVAYWEKNPNAVIVVTGGQGAQEDITEALAMERYLLAHGVDKDHIIKEERSTSTEENFVFSKALLDETLGRDHTACFITNEYHIYRAGELAKQAGYEQITHMHSRTKWYSILPGTLRECLAVLKFWIF